MPADDTDARGDADLETTHLNPVLERTVLGDTVFEGTGLEGTGLGAEPDRTGEGGGAEPEEEWPPREWRETTRSAGHRQAAYVALGMIAVFAVIVVVAIWASRNG